MDSSSFELKNILLSTQITAVSVVDDIIYIGEGQVLHIYDLKDASYIASAQVFTAAAIHGIKSAVFDDTPDVSKTIKDIEKSSISSIQNHTVIWGQKSLVLVKILKDCKKIKIILPERNIEDWIVDVSQEKSGNLVIATAHNKLLCYSLQIWKCLQPINIRKEIQKKSNEEIQGSNVNLYSPIEENCVVGKSECKENCILYCGYLDVQGNWEDSLLLAGTVFSQVLIWGPKGEKDENGKIIPLHRLNGHQGVIFSIKFSSEKNLLTTTSDDRTLRIWNVESTGVCKNNYSYWENAIVTEKHACYGHAARVWQSIILADFIVTIGEDSQIIIWDYEGKQINSWKAHEGSSIWCMAASGGMGVSPESEVPNSDNFPLSSWCTKLVTGGDDGSVRVWSLGNKEKETLEELSHLPWKDQQVCNNDISNDTTFSNTDELLVNNSMNKKNSRLSVKEKNMECIKPLSNKSKTSNENPKKDFPRSVCLLGNNYAYIMLDSGKLYCYNIVERKWNLVFQEETYKNYSILESSPDQNHIALANLHGNCKIFHKEEDESIKEICTSQLYLGKIFALKWLSESLMISSASEGNMDLWKLQEGSLNNCGSFLIPPCKQRWLAAACITLDPLSLTETYLICGDRAGSLHLYVFDNSNSIHSLKSIHGKNGVTSVNLHQNCIYSSGRDGFIRRFTVENQQLKPLSVIKIGGGSWIAGVMFPYNNPLALVFHDKNLQVFNIDEGNILATIECGGGHRSWDLFMTKEVLVFLFVKDTVPYIYEFNIQESMKTIVKSALHSREITCLLPIFNHSDDLIFITSSEDTTLRLHSTKNIQERQTISILKSHISNVRTLCHIEQISSTVTDEGGKCTKEAWIVSAGGRAQVKVWCIKDQRSYEHVETKTHFSSLSVACQEIASHMIRTGSNKTWKSQELTFDPETRYMDAAAWWLKQGHALLVLASSDGALRFFHFNSIVGELNLVHTEDSSHCLLQVDKIDVPGSQLIISTATSGQVTIWDIQNVVKRVMMKIEEDIVPSINNKIHQILQKQLHQSGINAIGLIKLETDKEVQQPFIYNYHLATAGDDCQLNICKIVVTRKDNLHEDECHRVELYKLVSVNAHSSQITGISWLTSNQLITASVDQRLVVWQLSTQTLLNNTSLTCINSIFSGVPDIKGCATICKSSKKQKDMRMLLVYGAGLQVYSLTNM